MWHFSSFIVEEKFIRSNFIALRGKILEVWDCMVVNIYRPTDEGDRAKM